MYYDILILLVIGIIGLLAHAARKRRWLEWLLRILIFNTFLFEFILYSNRTMELLFNRWASDILLASCIATPLILFIPARRFISSIFTALDLLISGQIFIPLLPMFRKVTTLLEYWRIRAIFVPTSIPHMVALYIFITIVAYLASSTDPTGLNLPGMPLAIPLPLGQLFSYNGLGLVILSFCGIGIFVSRSPKEAMSRLGWSKPSWTQVGIGIALIFLSFLYDALWAVYTHHLWGQDLASKLSSYNAGTFAVAGGFAPSVVLALATALCAGIGEETLIRGALQPVFGILPAAILHGMLHGQFAHAPIFIIQVAVWSMCMGIVRRYTNTTTTIIGHAGFNFVTTFLFAFNP